MFWAMPSAYWVEFLPTEDGSFFTDIRVFSGRTAVSLFGRIATAIIAICALLVPSGTAFAFHGQVTASFFSSQALKFKRSPLPVISGRPVPGETLTAQEGNWSPTPAFTYQWKVNSVPVGTDRTYEVKDADLGRSVTVTVIAALAGYPTTKRTSVKSTVVSSFISAPVPVLDDSPHVGDVLEPGCASQGLCADACLQVPCDAVYEDDWSPTPTKITYQWLRDGAAIKKATKRSYTVADDDAGKALSLKVTATKASFEKTSVVSAPTDPVVFNEFEQTPSATLSSEEPAIGQSITASVDDWLPTPRGMTYQWLRNGVAIKGATKLSYIPILADLGQTLSFAVTGTLPTYTPTTKTTVASTAVAKGVLGSDPSPVVDGIEAVGKKLTAVMNPWTPKTAKLAYRWLRGDEPIAAATSSTYTLTALDQGEKVSVQVTGSLAGYFDKVITSAPTEPIYASTFSKIPSKLNVSGSLKIGQTLTVDTGAWTPSVADDDFTFEWFDNGETIDGAESASFDLDEGYAGHKITVRVTAHSDGLAPVSIMTGPAGTWTVKTYTQTISGSDLSDTCTKDGDTDDPCAISEDDENYIGVYSSGENDENGNPLLAGADFSATLDHKPISWKVTFLQAFKTKFSAFTYYGFGENDATDAQTDFLAAIAHKSVSTKLSKLANGNNISFWIGSYSEDEYFMFSGVTITYTAYL
jgi:hypothetical protein